VLSKGSSFGDLALIKDQPRTASIQCLEDCHLAILDKASYDEILGELDAKRLNSYMVLLKNQTFFSGWTQRKLEKLIYCFTPRKFQRNQIVFRESEPAEEMFMILKGEFKLMKKYPTSQFLYQ
jgi:cAMP-dependent protein kinase regulator